MIDRFDLAAARIMRNEYATEPRPLTPRVLAYVLVAPSIAAELSAGEGLHGEPIFDVRFAVLRPDGTTFRLTTRSVSDPPFCSRMAAEEHINATVQRASREAPKRTPEEQSIIDDVARGNGRDWAEMHAELILDQARAIGTI